MNPDPASSHPHAEPLAAEEPALSLDDLLLELEAAEEAAEEAAQPCEPCGKICGVVLGTLTAVEADGAARVDFAGNAAPEPLVARSATPLGADDVGRDVALAFEGGNPGKPIVLGLIQHLRQAAPGGQTAAPPAAAPLAEATVDGRRVVVTAEQEIVLRCGKASITLTRAGKILIRGAYLLSRSSGVNRIKGGSVQIN